MRVSQPAFALQPPIFSTSSVDNVDDFRSVYFSLLDFAAERAAETRALAQEFVQRQLQRIVQKLQPSSTDMSGDSELLSQWIDSNTASVGRQYRDYVEARQRGEPRRFFRSQSHALYFLNAVAPTKLVDGAWLYGICAHWADPAMRPLLRIYLEELGDGDAALNHVRLYRELLATHECEDFSHLSPQHYEQGAMQLALAHLADDYLPEIIGFNLAYEQLPLHLLITAYELRELGIDPFYFTLHITVDNSHTGHAHKALQALLELQPRENVDAFMRRVQRGAALNAVGIGTVDIIDRFDLEQTLLRVLVEKANIGQYLHGDFCRVGGRTMTEWLREPDRMPEFLQVMQRTGWIRRGEQPEESRFWQLLTGDKARMFGVFNRFELQVLRDWICGDACDADATHALRVMQNSRNPVIEDHGGDAHRLRRAAAQSNDIVVTMNRLLPWLAPDRHYRAGGLYATRLFSELLG